VNGIEYTEPLSWIVGCGNNVSGWPHWEGDTILGYNNTLVNSSWTLVNGSNNYLGNADRDNVQGNDNVIINGFNDVMRGSRNKMEGTAVSYIIGSDDEVDGFHSDAVIGNHSSIIYAGVGVIINGSYSTINRNGTGIGYGYLTITGDNVTRDERYSPPPPPPSPPSPSPPLPPFPPEARFKCGAHSTTPGAWATQHSLPATAPFPSTSSDGTAVLRDGDIVTFFACNCTGGWAGVDCAVPPSPPQPPPPPSPSPPLPSPNPPQPPNPPLPPSPPPPCINIVNGVVYNTSSTITTVDGNVIYGCGSNVTGHNNTVGREQVNAGSTGIVVSDAVAGDGNDVEGLMNAVVGDGNYISGDSYLNIAVGDSNRLGTASRVTVRGNFNDIDHALCVHSIVTCPPALPTHSSRPPQRRHRHRQQ
jgi:hypothetical protein